MTNQAAQKMPPLPSPYSTAAGFALFNSDQMRQYARDHAAALSQTAGVPEPGRYFADGPQGHFFADDLQLARDLVNLYDKDDDWTITDLRNPTGAAPAASGGEDECSANFTGHKFGPHGPKGATQCEWCGEEPQPPAGASVSERARELLAAEYLDDPTLAEKIRAGTSRNGDVPRALRALEQALTQQREEPIAFVPVHPRNGPLWGDAYPNGNAADGRSPHYERMPLYTTPQPGAERQPNVVRIPQEKRWVEGDSDFLRGHANGYNSALSDVMSVNQGVSRIEPAEQPGAEALRELVQRWRDEAAEIDAKGLACNSNSIRARADELESLLARAG